MAKSELGDRRSSCSLLAARYSPLADLRIKTPAVAAGVGDLVRLIKRALLAILLDAGGAQPGQAMLVDRILPGQEFLDRQGIAAAGFFERPECAAHSRDDFRPAADEPTLCPPR